MSDVDRLIAEATSALDYARNKPSMMTHRINMYRLEAIASSLLAIAIHITTKEA